MSLKSGVVRGAFSLGGARVLVSLLNTAGILVLARLLTPADFGVVAIVTAILSIVMSMTEASLQPALIQCREPTPEHVDTVWTMSLIRAASILGMFVLAAWPLSLIYDDARLFPAFVLAGVTGAFTEFYNPLITLSQRGMQFRPTMLFQIFQKFISLAIAVGLALWFRSFWAILIGNAAGAVLASIGSYFLIAYRPRLTLSRTKEIWQFSSWMFLSQLCETLAWRFDQLAISLAATKTQLGLYSMADNLAMLPVREMGMPVRRALFAGLANLKAFPERTRISFLRSQSTVAMVTAPAAIGLALVADPAVRVVLGDKWLASIPFVRFLAIAYALDAFITVVGPLAMAMGKTKILFQRQLAALMIRIPLIIAGLLLAGPLGAALGRMVSAVLNGLIGLFVVRKLVGLPVLQQLRSHALTSAGLLAMGIAVSIVDAGMSPLLPSAPIVKLVTLILLGGLTYCGTIFSIWLMRGREEGPVSELVAIFATLPCVPAVARLLRSKSGDGPAEA